MLSLAVNANDNFLFEATESEHQPTENSDEFMEQESEQEDSSFEEDSPDYPDPEDQSSQDNLMQGACLTGNTESCINEVDAELCQKIQKLRDEMEEQGMHQVISLLEDCFSPKDKHKGKSTGQEKIPKVIKNNPVPRHTENDNTNHNRSVQIQPSEETIYENAVQKRVSSSSEDNLEFSDESFNNGMRSIAEKTPPSAARPKPGTNSNPEGDVIPVEPTIQDRADETIRRAEAAKAKIFLTTGELDLSQFHSVVKINHNYQLVGSHVDQATKEKIIKGEFVDFGKLFT